jgi:hypothetical protein
MAPHCATRQETDHVTPCPDVSPLNTAVTEVFPVATTEFELADTEMVIPCDFMMIGELPPQLVMANVSINARRVRSNGAMRFMETSANMIEGCNGVEPGSRFPHYSSAAYSENLNDRDNVGPGVSVSKERGTQQRESWISNAGILNRL